MVRGSVRNSNPGGPLHQIVSILVQASDIGSENFMGGFQDREKYMGRVVTPGTDLSTERLFYIYSGVH